MNEAGVVGVVTIPRTYPTTINITNILTRTWLPIILVWTASFALNVSNSIADITAERQPQLEVTQR
jgi:hypothetical protein